jgi:hypothetical protein
MGISVMGTYEEHHQDAAEQENKSHAGQDQSIQ